jgi:hypothetical protein
MYIFFSVSHIMSDTNFRVFRIQLLHYFCYTLSVVEEKEEAFEKHENPFKLFLHGHKI